MAQVSRSLPLAAALSLLLPVGVNAVPINAFSVAASAQTTCPPGPNCLHDTGILSGQTATDAAVSFADVERFGRAKGQATIGSLGAEAFSQAPLGGMSAIGFARFSDALEVTSLTLATGTPVTLHVEMLLDGIVSLLGASDQASVTVTGQVGAGHVYREFYAPGHVTKTGSPTFDVATTVGALLTFVASLEVVTGAGPAGSAYAGYLSTARFTIESLTPGASFVSSSGQTYAVPEPRLLALLGAGGVALGWARRRKP